MFKYRLLIIAFSLIICSLVCAKCGSPFFTIVLKALFCYNTKEVSFYVRNKRQGQHNFARI